MAKNYRDNFDYSEAIANSTSKAERDRLLAERQNKIDAERGFGRDEQLPPVLRRVPVLRLQSRQRKRRARQLALRRGGKGAASALRGRPHTHPPAAFVQSQLD